jgi:hypothetical protein
VTGYHIVTHCHQVPGERMGATVRDVQGKHPAADHVLFNVQRIFARRHGKQEIARHPVREPGLAFAEVKVRLSRTREGAKLEFLSEDGAQRHAQTRNTSITAEVIVDALAHAEL